MATLAMIAYGLESFNPTLHVLKRDKHDLASARLISSVGNHENLLGIPSSKGQSQKNLYVTSSSDDLAASEEYILVSLQDPKIEGISYIYIDGSRYAAEDVAAAAQDIIENYELNFYRKLASSALFDRDLDKLLEIALPFFNNPMYIADSAFVCLARTKNYSVKNMTVQWDEISNRGVLKVAVKPSTISQLDKLKKASFSYSDDRAERNIAAHIERDGKRVANLCIIESDNKCYDFHLDLADYLCKCIESVIETKYYLESSSSIVYEEWLMLLCMGKPVRNGVIVPHLNELGWNDVGYFRIAIVDFINKLDSESTLSYRRR